MTNSKKSEKNQAEPSANSRMPHRVAWLLALIVFPLIWVGGLVTTYDAGMAVPDWPNTYNYNMFAYPVRDWFFGPWDLFVEHGHRLLGSLAGVVAIALLVVTIRKEKRIWVRWLAFLILVLVIAQGALGGARVLLNERFLAKAHGCLGPAFFACVISFLAVTSRGWKNRFGQQQLANFQPSRAATFLKRASFALLITSYGQLVIGAFLRHIHIEARPSAYLGLVAMHITTAVLIVLGTLIHWLISRRSEFRGLKLQRSVNILGLLVMAQFALGLGTWVVKYGWPVWFENLPFAASFVVMEKSFWQMNLVTAHVAVGSLILAFWTANTLQCHRSLARIAAQSERTNDTSTQSRPAESQATDKEEITTQTSTQPLGA